MEESCLARESQHTFRANTHTHTPSYQRHQGSTYVRQYAWRGRVHPSHFHFGNTLSKCCCDNDLSCQRQAFPGRGLVYYRPYGAIFSEHAIVAIATSCLSACLPSGYKIRTTTAAFQPANCSRYVLRQAGCSCWQTLAPTFIMYTRSSAYIKMLLNRRAHVCVCVLGRVCKAMCRHARTRPLKSIS